MRRGGGQAHVPADVGRRRLLHPRHLAPHALPVLVEAPQQRRQPREPALREHHPEVREAREHALGDEAEQLHLGDVDVREVVLQVGRAEPGRARRRARAAPGVQRHAQAVALGRLVERVVEAGCRRGRRSGPAGGSARSARRRPALDSHRGGMSSVEHHQARPQALVARQPLVAQPVVDRRGDRGRVVRVAVHAVEHNAAQPARRARVALEHRRQLVNSSRRRRARGRRARRVGEVGEPDRRVVDVRAPVVVEVAHQDVHRGRREVDVAVDRAPGLRRAAIAHPRQAVEVARRCRAVPSPSAPSACRAAAPAPASRSPSAGSPSRTSACPEPGACSSSWTKCAGSRGSSIGWVSYQKCSAKYSDGLRWSFGTSPRASTRPRPSATQRRTQPNRPRSAPPSASGNARRCPRR